MNKEIVIIMGYNAAGKSTLVQSFVEKGYLRINRDILGGSLEKQAEYAGRTIGNGEFKLVLDNTYPSVKSRASIIKVAKDNKIPIRCVHLTTSFEDAQLNACLRMVRAKGRLLQPEEFKTINDPNMFPPVALFHYRKEFQKPTTQEGFSTVEEVPFYRNWDKSIYKNKALILDYDGTLRLSTGKQKYPIELSDIQMLPGRAEVLKQYKDDGYVLLGASNQSGIARGTPIEKVVACFEETNRLLGFKIDYHFCPHRIPPVSCYCRKPHPGIGAYFIEKYKLLPSTCIMVGDMTSDSTFADRCGFDYCNAEDFFK